MMAKHLLLVKCFFTGAEVFNRAEKENNNNEQKFNQNKIKYDFMICEKKTVPILVEGKKQNKIFYHVFEEL